MKTRLIAQIFFLMSFLPMAAQSKDPFWLGADISGTTMLEKNGGKVYNVQGKERENTTLMKELGLNAIRLRIWVNPPSGWCNKKDALVIAKRAKALGMPVMVSFHYSDTWSDPSHQTPPVEWKNYSYKDLKQAVARHTKETLQLFKDNGIDVKWVGVGNETTEGMLWPEGQAKENMKQYAGLTEAGYQASKNIYPEAKVIVHLDCGCDAKRYNFIFDGLKKYNAHWDLIGMSVYPYWDQKAKVETTDDGTLNDAIANMNALCNKYGCDCIVVETGYEVNRPNEGHLFMRKLIRATRNLTNGHCKGVFYWAPELEGEYPLGAFKNGRPTAIMDAFTEESNRSESSIINSSTAASTTDTKYGKVCGYIYKGVYTYKGIPYAKAKRFEVPQEPDAWKGIRSCRTYGPSAPQPKTDRWKNDASAFFYLWNEGDQSEDCLRLNIWTKDIHNGKKSPVIVWLHGGGFVEGCGQDHPGYHGHNLADKGNVVVVTINHRLNTLGYTDLSDYGDKYQYSGNAGNIDIVQAFKWIHDNIQNFGGDPDCVTIFGQSGGGAKTSSMLCMPMAQGLFHRAMVMSGSGFMRGMKQNLAKKIGQRTVQILGLNKDNIDKIQTLDYGTVLKANSQAMKEIAAENPNNSSFGRSLTWEPVIDGDALPAGLFMDGSEKISKDIPLIIGSTLNEFSAWHKHGKDINTWDDAKADLEKTMGKKASNFVDAFRHSYPDDDVDALYRLDTMVRPAAIEQIQTRVADGGAPVWNYLFSYQLPSEDSGFHAGHNADIAFYFDNVIRSANMTGATPEGIELGEIMSTTLINFARTGKPSSLELPEWKPVTSSEMNTMIWNCPSCRLATNHDAELIKILRNK